MLICESIKRDLMSLSRSIFIFVPLFGDMSRWGRKKRWRLAFSVNSAVNWLDARYWFKNRSDWMPENWSTLYHILILLRILDMFAHNEYYCGAINAHAMVLKQQSHRCRRRRIEWEANTEMHSLTITTTTTKTTWITAFGSFIWGPFWIDRATASKITSNHFPWKRTQT